MKCLAASLSRLPSRLRHELRQLETKTIYLLASFGNLMACRMLIPQAAKEIHHIYQKVIIHN